jgi:DMSO/TMAO reductase YedYZ molybdopterin-dependent catalytic subunit
MNGRHPDLVLPDEEIRRHLRRRTRRDFLIAGLAAAGAIGGYEWITRAEDDNETPWPQRRVLDFNGKLSHGYLSDSHLMPTYSPDRVGWLKPNGNIGLEQPLDASKWALRVETGGRAPALRLALADIMALPKVEMITQFCCIEGWSTVAHWAGARFSDFTKKYFPPNRPLPDFVYMATRAEDYYVGLDMKSALHPQTLLAYEQNGKPLEDRHGAPLRLVIPVKYGIKNIKRVALIRYTSQKPGDYWAEEGYDWFAGL